MEVPIHEYTYMDLDIEKLVTSFRIIVREPGAPLNKARYLFGFYDPAIDDREQFLDDLMELFVMHYDNGYTEIVDYFLPKEAG